MPRRRYNRTSQVQKRIEKLVDDHGFEIDTFNVPATVYRTRTGKVFHGQRKCRDIRDKRDVRTDEMLMADALEANACDCVFDDAEGELGRRLEAAQAILDTETRHALVAANVSILGIQGLTAAVEHTERLPVAAPLRSRWETALTHARELLSSADADRCRQEAPYHTVRQCVLDLELGRPTRDTYSRQYPDPDLGADDELLKETSYGGHVGLNRAWSAFYNAVRADQTTVAAVEAATAAALAELPQAPVALSQTAQIEFSELADPGFGFTNVNDALAVAWRRRADAAVAAAAGAWAARLDAAVDDALSTTDVCVVAIPHAIHRTYHGTAASKDLRTEAMDKIGVFNPHDTGTHTIFAAPVRVVEWLTSRTPSLNVYEAVGAAYASDPVPAGRVAAALQIAEEFLCDNSFNAQEAVTAAALTAMPAA